ncbi:MAG: cytidylate kinase-like family protein [Acidobacteriaceae bacterium]|nr:cytidylate kinase-like family protein [Acidobacteriaceae bacterium]
MYRIITIEREYGCGAGQIACQLAERLGWKLWDHALTEEIAKLANVECAAVERCEERADSTFRRLVNSFLRGSYESRMSAAGNEPFNTDRFVDVGHTVMENVAKNGNGVIVGRGAPYFLRERADVFHVFLYAPFPEKVRRLKLLGKSQQEAEHLLDNIDRERIEFVKRYFDADWPTRSLYHLMINTAIGNENVISIVLDSMCVFEKGPIRVQPPTHSGEQVSTQ